MVPAGWVGPGGTFEEESVMAAGENSSVDKLPGTAISVDEPSQETAIRSRPVRSGRLPISEMAYDRPAAPSPFGDDVVFPLPVSELQYTHTTTP
jgi:hypothetical protein